MMSAPGRGRGYTGRHHLREHRPGDHDAAAADLEAARTLAELSPRSTEPTKMDAKQEYAKNRDGNPDAAGGDHPSGRGTADAKYAATAEDDAVVQELLNVDEQYAPLLVLLEQFSPGEDGIQFNRKLRHFETTVTNMCADEASLYQAFGAFRAAALRSSVTARKLAAVGSSFTRQQRQQLLRRVLLDVVMEGTFSKLDVLSRCNPSYLINAANLLGDYFAEARLCNGNKVQILASPLLHYMRALLASDDIRAHRSLATQLMQNGRELLAVLSPELDELSISIRLRLLSPPPVSIIWLLLSADLCLNKFLPLPSTLQQFYAAHLDLTADENYSEVSYGSWKKTERDNLNRSDATADSCNADKLGHNLSQASLDDSGTMKPKLRPILGAGAGLLRQEQAVTVGQDNFETWTAKNSLSKRYDLNSWRQDEEIQQEETEPITTNTSVLPPNLQHGFTVPDYPPPNINRYNNYNQQDKTNYLQQGDGVHIQNQYATSNSNFTPQGDTFVPTQYVAERSVQAPEKVNSEVQKTCSRKPMENWRQEKPEKEDPNRNRPRNWSRQQSRDTDDENTPYKEVEKRSSSRSNRDVRPARANRRNSETSDGGTVKPQTKKHVTDVPRSQKYWDHDDRCDKDYNS